MARVLRMPEVAANATEAVLAEWLVSENAEFARAAEAAGITWIGPPPEVIEVMGSKVASRHAALAAGVEPVPGTTHPVTSVGDVLAFAHEHGWPVAIKASYGGGGKGLRVAFDEKTAKSGFESAQREAQAYFGNAEIYLERYLERPHHVEIQVLADTHGNCVWLGERDCSAQRRHQKLVEESPSPAVDEDLRRRMGEAAVAVAKSTGYVNAGTVECLLQDGEFWFLEMNTRLQVEHPVTELCTGIDLVHAQLRIAAGEPLWFTQTDVTPRGHAIEMRINAENPAKNFLPSPGRIARYAEPGGPGVRVDAGYGEGDEISQYYDNLVAKLVVWGSDREQARRRALRALDEYVVEGVHTTIPAHKLILQHRDFFAGEITTKWVENAVDLSDLPVPAPLPRPEEGEAPLVERTSTVEVDGRRFEVKMWLPEDATAAASPPAARKAPRRGERRASGSGGAAGAAGAAGVPGAVTTPMQGTILKILVTAGQTVKAGEAVVVLEAMKMENNINAPADGTVAEIKVATGDTVGSGDTLLVLE